jgi:hypothetical protein
MTTSWKKRTEDELWLRVLSQVVVAGNAAPGDTLRASTAVRENLAFRRLKKLSPQRRRKVIHAVLRAIRTRYVGDSVSNPKIDAAMHNFDKLVEARGPKQFFKKVASMKTEKERIKYLSHTLAFYKKKGCRDALIDLRLKGLHGAGQPIEQNSRVRRRKGARFSQQILRSHRKGID